jgi:Baseplate J-like protein
MSDVGVLVSLDDQSIEQSRVVLDYTSRDYTAIRAQLIGLAKGMMPEWETAGEAPDFGTLLVELFAYMGDVLNFYIDRTASEAFLGTAQRRQSVLYIADMLGYTPIGQQAASVELFFSVDPEETVEEIVLPIGTRIRNEANNADDLIVFETDAELRLHPGDVEIPVFATEGVTVHDSLAGTTQGTPNTEFVLPDKGVVYGSILVTSREGYQVVDWTYTSDLALARPTQAVFTTYIDDQELTHIVFGDNAAGRIPPVNAEIYVTYRFGKGAAANSLAPDAVNTISPVPGLDLWAVTVRNKESPVGGTDPESIDSMRFSIPRASNRLKQRAVTLADYADLAMQVPGVAKSVSYGTIYTAVHVRIAPQEGKANVDYMQRLCNSVEFYMADKIMIGSTVYAEPIDVNELWHDVYVRITVHVLAAYNRNAVRQQVDTVVRSLLAFNSVDFGTLVSIGQIYRAILAVQGVEWAELQWLSTEPPPSELIFAPALLQQPESRGTATTRLFSGVWAYDIETVMADPGAGDFRTNNATTPGTLAMAATDGEGTDFHTDLVGLRVGDHIVMYNSIDPSSWLSLMVTALPTDNTTWVLVPVTRVDGSTDEGGTPNPPLPPGNPNVRFEFIRYAPTPITPTGDVQNIDTPELLIPRIEPTEIIEDEATFPDMDEPERTHDGLWVFAVGGLANT